MLSLTILTILIIISWARVARPGNVSVAGRLIYNARLPLLARLRMHAVVSAIVLGTATILALVSDLPWWGVLMALLADIGLIALPIRYTLTNMGIRCGWTPFRRWTEFGGVSRAPGGARLQGTAGSRDMRIWLSGSLGDDEFLHLIKRMITSSYKGQNVLIEFPPQSSKDSPGTMAATTDTSGTAL